MSFIDMEPTEENLVETIKSNIFNRNKELKSFYDVVCRGGLKSIALDGAWGSGKTFFVKQLQLLINTYNQHSTMNTETRDIIKEHIPLNEKESNKMNICIYYDAWKDDGLADPLCALIYNIAIQMGSSYEFKEHSILQIAASILEFATSRNVNNIIDSFKGEDPLSAVKKEMELEAKIGEFFRQLLYENGNHMVIIIDELDRCKPTYAVSLLERIKHFFTNEDITFLFSTNMRELQHSVKNFYGTDYDAFRYLERFFDYSIEIPVANYERFHLDAGLNNTYVVDQTVKEFIYKENLSIREQIRYINQVKTALYKFMNNTNSSKFSFNDGRGRELILIFITPILIGLKQIDTKEYEKFISGNGVDCFLRILSFEAQVNLASQLLEQNETLYENQEGSVIVKAEDKAKAFYDAIFNYDRNYYEINIGKTSFTKGSFAFAISSASGLTDYAEFCSDNMEN